MKNLYSSYVFLMLSVNVLLAQNIQHEPNTFLSPSKKFRVIFVKEEEQKYNNSDNIDEVSYIKYKLVIVNTTKNDTITHDFFDVHGDRSPSKPSKLFSEIFWNNTEDFIQLPEADWPRAPGAPAYPVINLNKKYNWTTGIMTIYHNFWLDDLRVVGNCDGDCSISVEMFDGTTGKMVTIIGSESPRGYRIYSAKNDTLIVESVLDNCSQDEDEAKFKPVKKKIPFSVIRKLKDRK